MKEIKLTQGKVALVDDEDFEYLNQWKWHAMKIKNAYYAKRSVEINGKSKSILMHRIIMNTPDNLQIDHVFHNTFDNRIEFFEYNWYGNTQGGKPNFNNSGLDSRIHPTQKPIILYSWILRKYAKPGDTIFDSHMGSQSSRIACYDGGFDFVGCEIDKDYFDAGCKRFEIFKSQGKLF